MKIDVEADKQGEFEITAHTFYTEPYAVIRAGALVLGDISEDDANRMIAALCEAKNKIAALREQYAQPHKPPFASRRCLNCGKPADDEIHAEPKPAVPVIDVRAPALEGNWCPAKTVLDDEVTVYCDRDAGHPGSHHAPGPDEGSEVAWGDEAAEPRSGCTCGHTGTVHFLDLLAGGELTHCHVCDCTAYDYVAASVAS